MVKPIEVLAKEYELAVDDPELKAIYNFYREAERNDILYRNAAIQEGLEEGLERGLERGLHQGKLAVAREMLLEGMTLESISRLAKLPLHQVEALLSNETKQ